MRGRGGQFGVQMIQNKIDVCSSQARDTKFLLLKLFTTTIILEQNIYLLPQVLGISSSLHVIIGSGTWKCLKNLCCLPTHPTLLRLSWAVTAAVQVNTKCSPVRNIFLFSDNIYHQENSPIKEVFLVQDKWVRWLQAMFTFYY